MPTLETLRLIIRPFSMDDLQPMHRLLDVVLREVELGTGGGQTLHEHAEWWHRHAQCKEPICGIALLLRTSKNVIKIYPIKFRSLIERIV